MANRRNFRRHRGVGNSFPDVVPESSEGDSTEPVSLPTASSELEEGQAWDSVRPGKIARARRLVEDPNYPSKQVIESVAVLLAGRLDQPPR
jgi:hypothetical protein